MYAWDRFTMSLVLMYSKPTWEQTRAVESLAAGHLQPAPAPGTGTSTCAHGVGPLAAQASAPAYLIEGRLPEPVLPEQQVLGAGRGQKGAVLPWLLSLRPVPLPGAQVEQQREDGAHANHQQGQVLGRGR